MKYDTVQKIQGPENKSRFKPNPVLSKLFPKIGWRVLIQNLNLAFLGTPLEDPKHCASRPAAPLGSLSSPASFFCRWWMRAQLRDTARVRVRAAVSCGLHPPFGRVQSARVCRRVRANLRVGERQPVPHMLSGQRGVPCHLQSCVTASGTGVGGGMLETLRVPSAAHPRPSRSDGTTPRPCSTHCGQGCCAPSPLSSSPRLSALSPQGSALPYSHSSRLPVPTPPHSPRSTLTSPLAAPHSPLTAALARAPE